MNKSHWRDKDPLCSLNPCLSLQTSDLQPRLLLTSTRTLKNTKNNQQQLFVSSQHTSEEISTKVGVNIRLAQSPEEHRYANLNHGPELAHRRHVYQLSLSKSMDLRQPHPILPWDRNPVPLDQQSDKSAWHFLGPVSSKKTKTPSPTSHKTVTENPLPLSPANRNPEPWQTMTKNLKLQTKSSNQSPPHCDKRINRFIEL